MTRNQSEVNSDAALGGLDAQRWLVGILNDWRNDPLGAALASHLFGYDVCVSSEMIKADEYPNTSYKPDVWAQIIKNGVEIDRKELSLKLIGTGTETGNRPTHHASRVSFKECSEHGLLPSEDPVLESLILEHFIDGIPLSGREIDEREAVLTFYNSNRESIARAALAGLRSPYATHMILMNDNEDGVRQISVIDMENAIKMLAAPEYTLSNPTEGRLGTIGNHLVHLQRGQALSVGHQRDIQVKINAFSLFLAGTKMEPLL